MRTGTDGSISGDTETNDPDDKGLPNGYDRWQVRYRDYATMKSATGLSHTGVIGCVVTVFLDGVKV
jgi:hypothetical protein